MNLDEYLALRNAKKKFEEMSGFNNGDPNTNGEYHLLRSIAKHLNIFADVGYNEGYISEFMEKAKPGIKIFGFEPNPKLAKAAKHKIFQNALSDKPGKASFYIHKAETGVSSLAERTEFNPSFRAGFEEINVEVKRLDDFIGEFSTNAFIKIDVEGFEAPVIRGASEIFKKYKPVGFFEYTNGWLEAKEKLRDLFYHLDAIGYSCYRITPLGLEHLRFFHHILENYNYQNIFFCPKDYLDDKFQYIDIPNEFSTARFYKFDDRAGS